MAETQNTDAGWRSQPGTRWAGRTLSKVAATKAGWDLRDVVDEVERDGLGVDQSQVRHKPHASLLCANCARSVGPSVADAVSPIRT